MDYSFNHPVRKGRIILDMTPSAGYGFFDDRLDYMAGAEEVGSHVFLFENISRAKGELTRLSVKVKSI